MGKVQWKKNPQHVEAKQHTFKQNVVEEEVSKEINNNNNNNNHKRSEM